MDKVLTSKCHCGSVELQLTLPNGLEKLRRCNCSICSRRNAVVASVSINNLKVVKGERELNEYTFNTHAAKHYFCSKCGIYTHHQRRSVTTEYGFNIACVEGVKIEDYLHIGYLDGRDNHPKDVRQ
tara:strand:- start:145 stop:522 length:378 start_codon:yes stop_codon:yes gene_type:complete